MESSPAGRLILVKHSLPEILPEHPRREWRLSDEGRARCARLAERLRRYSPRRIVTSPEPKAHETARLVAAALGALSVETLDELHEHDDRDAPFQDEAAFRATVREFFADPAEAVFGPETADEAHARFSAAVDALPVPSGGSANVVVAHGRVISLYVARRSGFEPYALWVRLGLPAFVVLDLPSRAVAEVVERV